MTVLIDNRQDMLEITEEMESFVNRIVKSVLDYEEWNEDFEISISFVGNQEIQALNKQFRSINAPTDVLSFPMLEIDAELTHPKSNMDSTDIQCGMDPQLNKVSFNDEPEDCSEDYFGGEQPLGDIVISVEKAIEQAGEYGHSKEREIAFLLVHGMLHLLGYDHEDRKDEMLMFKKQDSILDILKIRR